MVAWRYEISLLVLKNISLVSCAHSKYFSTLEEKRPCDILHISYHIMSCHVMSCHISYHHIVSYHIIHCISYHIISYIISYHIISYHINRNDSLRSLVQYFSTLEEKLRISARPCNILYISYHISYHIISYYILNKFPSF